MISAGGIGKKSPIARIYLRREALLPTEIEVLNLRYVKRVSENEYSAACPKCGGGPHRNGELPDRFRVFVRSKAYGGLLGWCRKCGYKWTPQGEKIDPVQHKKWVDEQKRVEEERRAEAERALELLRREQAWVKYHLNLNGETRQMYHARGISDEWVDYWMLGYNPAKVVWDNEGEFTTPALTIPVFLPGQDEPLTIRNRLLSPRREGDKYRPEFGHLPSSLFYGNRVVKPAGRVLLVEGEFKAMTTYITLGMEMFVVGTPGKTPSPEMLKSQLKDCDEVFICLDPDAYHAEGLGKISPIRRMIDIFGERSRIIQVPYKIDDMITGGYLDKKGLMGLISGARRIRI